MGFRNIYTDIYIYITENRPIINKYVLSLHVDQSSFINYNKNRNSLNEWEVL